MANPLDLGSVEETGAIEAVNIHSFIHFKKKNKYSKYTDIFLSVNLRSALVSVQYMLSSGPKPETTMGQLRREEVGLLRRVLDCQVQDKL